MPQTIKAVHDDDLLSLLESLNLLNKFNAGKLTCAFCGDIINYNNLHSLLPDSGTIKLVCSKPSCVSLLMGKLEDNKYE